ncbi:trehalase-like domain-containing protein [Arthrobacter sp. A5]|uniref:trehalase-like domain-containing protein n=1 Tax=Arthrobacter sp. A5 TaxID=576926 RepID=UPI003DA7E9E4
MSADSSGKETEHMVGSGTPSMERPTAAISDYGLLGDCHGAALVSRDGSVDWWCPPRFDAPSVFGRLLDPRAGHWSIRPATGYSVERRYVEGSMVVETDFRCDSGVLRVSDGLLLGAGERGHEIGCGSPPACSCVRCRCCRGKWRWRWNWCPGPSTG